MTPVAHEWFIPRNVKIILTCWALALFMFTGMFSLWQWRDRAAAEARDRAQDRAMCEMLDIIVVGPEPEPGPAGDRARDIRNKMAAYRATLACPA